MSNYSKIYWLTRLDNIHILFGVLAALSVALLIFYYIIKYIEYNNQEEIKEYKSKYSKFSTIAFWILVPSILISIFLPSKDEAIVIMAGGKTMDFIQSDTSINKIPSQTTVIISEYLEKTIKELQSKK